MSKEGEKEREELRGALRKVPDEVQSLQSSSVACRPGSQVQCLSGQSTGSIGRGRGRGRPRQDQQPGIPGQEPWERDQSLQTTRSEQQTPASAGGQGMMTPRGRGRGTPSSRIEHLSPGSRQDQSARPTLSQQQIQDQRPRAGPMQSQQFRQSTSLPQLPKETAKQMSDVPNITKALSEVELEEKPLNIPQRKDFTKAGTLGRNIRVLTNMLQINFGSNFKSEVYHYDVNIDPDKPKYLMRPVFEKARKQLFKDRIPAFDGKKNAYSPGRLPFRGSKTIQVTVYNEDGNEKQFKITLTEVAKLDLSWLKNVKPGLQESEKNQSCIQALDVILRMAPVSPELRATQIGRSFFTPPTGRPLSLGGGMDLWVGHFQSAILGWKPFLNLDVAHKGFPAAQSVINLMKTICGCGGQQGGGGGGGRGPPRGPPGRQYDQGPTELTVDNIERFCDEITRFLKGLKIVYEIPGEPTSRRTQRVNGLVQCPRFNCFERNGQKVSIEHYYKLEKQYNIKYPLFPCLWIGPRDKNIHVPVELCKIVEGQAAQKKLDENQTSQMIRHAATGTEERKQKIAEAFNKTRFNENPSMKEFGISVNGQFAEIPARVLDPPVLTYKNKDVTPAKGQWRIDSAKFLQSSSSISENNSWTILNLSQARDNDLYNFADELRKIAGGLGVIVGKYSSPFGKINTRHQNCMRDLSEFFTLQKRNGIKLVVVVIPDAKDPYCWVKQVSELNVGILTQCLKSKTLIKIQKDRSPATLTNILLKVNAKLNGVNHMIAEERKQLHELPYCLKEPCMIVGADVTHPSPDANDIPSIAAVVASHDPRAFQYNIEIKLQDPRQEIIQELAGIMKNQLESFYEKTGYWPFRIIFYRDGVSEGQFKQVLQQELPAIRRACKAVEPQVGKRYEPPITFLVVQKRHHTRFFPTDPRESDDKNFNVKAGTIVDTQITHPTDIDFYLVSHASIQGTARPTKYRLIWDDADMKEDEIEQLTYYLCHMFTRCTRSVSYPAPTYYAHLAAFRARNLTHDVKIDLNNLSREQRDKLTLRPDIQQGSPMFFV